MTKRQLAPWSANPDSTLPRQESKRPRSPRRSRVVMLGALLVVASMLGGYAVMSAQEEGEADRNAVTKSLVPADTDRDGLFDDVEKGGWVTKDGRDHRTDPRKADTDDDGLWDGDEAGALATNVYGVALYEGFSDPLSIDTDGDGLTDAEEADLGVDPVDRDTDDDRLEDGAEVVLTGTDPELADTDGDTLTDGYEDGNRQTQGLDPLSVDVRVSKWTYAGDFAKGALAGDLWREDSLAWLAGSLTSGAASSVPVVGSVVGAIADMRDAVGSAIHTDWVGSGFSAVGAVPGGDVIAVPGKAAKFVGRNPQLLGATAAIVATSTKLPESVKIKTAQALWGDDWDDLVQAGSSKKALLAIETGRKPLSDVAETLKRSGHVVGSRTSPFATGRDGESFLESLYVGQAKAVNTQVRASTMACGAQCSFSSFRYFDVLVDGVAHESKVGYVVPSQFTQRQIMKDAWLIKSGQIEGAHWHFFASSRSNTLGADPRVLALLDEQRIPYTVHLPR